MGQRTQLFIKIQDEDQNQIAGLVRHYQRGFGRVMLMDTLNLAINMPFTHSIRLNESKIPYLNSKTGLYLAKKLKQDDDFIDPVLAYEFSHYFENLSNSDSNELSDLSYKLDNYVPDTDIFKDINLETISDINKALDKLSRKYNDDINSYYQYTDNNDGYAELTATYDGKNSQIASPKSLKLRLFSVTHEPLTLHEYCQLSPEYTTPKFENAFALLADSYNIDLNK